METVTELERVIIVDEPQESETESSEIIYLGLDLGTSQSAIVTSTGLKLNIASVVGWPKDFVAFNVVKKNIVFGPDCIKHRPSLDFIYPLEKGVIKHRDKESSNGRQATAAVELLKYLMGLINKEDKQKIFAAVGVPAKAAVADKQVIIDAARGLVDSIMVVSEPFLVAYSLGIMGFAIVVDIGAGTTDTCRMHGVIPTDDDQRTGYLAGNEIDKKFMQLLKEKVSGIHIDVNLARKIKEEHGFVGNGPDKIEINFYVHGKLTTIDVANELKEACSIIVPDICNHIRDLIVSLDLDPEYKSNLARNIILAGGCSKIKGLAQEIAAKITDLGTLTINCVDDPFFRGALGGLKLAQDIPFTEWKPL